MRQAGVKGLIIKALEQCHHLISVNPSSKTATFPSADCASALVFVFVPAVSALPQEGRQQASDHAAATEALQEPDHPGLQDAGAGTHQHGRGDTT